MRKKLECSCVTVGREMLAPSIDCTTRWNSSCDMIDKGLKLEKALILLCETNIDLQSFQLTDRDWSLLRTSVKYLRLFKSLSNILCGEKYITIPLVIVGFNMLIDKLEKSINDLNLRKNKSWAETSVERALQSAYNKLMKHYSKTNWIYCAILMLDPRHKEETFYITPWGKEMAKWAIEKLEEIYRSRYYRIENNELEKSQLIENLDSDDEINPSSLFTSSDQKLSTSLVGKAVKENWRNEIDYYLSLKRADKNENVLKWWQQYEHKFPNLSRMAKDFLSIQATSVPVERLFSRASLTIRKHRNSLGKSTARQLLCLYSWTSLNQFSVFKLST
ncbi:zinc finger BED domain-containing protein RICESLEEPER 2-like [Leptopilina heterotoma]|uniref:zinc finger BED domain-containing protein RICESLEEPER 2-like n=1 Tax=Leptopilina heterotoma TaxID=63436 RepID=UPI001CA7CDE5|nr:zinc finger BED domain-containing protein RICESLEEPER 2-like [Leptopilina heterotoma]